MSARGDGWVPIVVVIGAAAGVGLLLFRGKGLFAGLGSVASGVGKTTEAAGDAVAAILEPASEFAGDAIDLAGDVVLAPVRAVHAIGSWVGDFFDDIF